MKRKITFLGHSISDEGSSPLQEKLDILRNFPVPTDKARCRTFVGSATYYKEFYNLQVADDLALIDRDINKPSWRWTAEREAAFNRVRDAMLNLPVLAYPNFDKPFRLSTDASRTAVGALLEQEDGNRWRPVAYASARNTAIMQRAWSVPDLEAFAIFWAVKKFQQYLAWKPFVLLSDHRPLAALFSKTASRRITNWALQLSHFTFTVQYRPGKENALADIASRYPTGSAQDDAEVGELADNEQLICQLVLDIADAAGLPLPSATAGQHGDTTSATATHLATMDVDADGAEDVELDADIATKLCPATCGHDHVIARPQEPVPWEKQLQLYHKHDCDDTEDLTMTVQLSAIGTESAPKKARADKPTTPTITQQEPTTSATRRQQTGKEPATAKTGPAKIGPATTGTGIPPPALPASRDACSADNAPAHDGQPKSKQRAHDRDKDRTQKNLNQQSAGPRSSPRIQEKAAQELAQAAAAAPAANAPQHKDASARAAAQPAAHQASAKPRPAGERTAEQPAAPAKASHRRAAHAGAAPPARQAAAPGQAEAPEAAPEPAAPAALAMPTHLDSIWAGRTPFGPKLITLHELRHEQKGDPEASLIVDTLLQHQERRDPADEQEEDKDNEYELARDGCLYKLKPERRLYVPRSLRRRLLHLTHSVPAAPHLGVKQTLTQLENKYFWKGMATDVHSYVTSCQLCQLRKEVRRRAIPDGIVRTSDPEALWSMDILGPVTATENGYRYIAVVINHATRFPWAYPLKDITSAAIAKGFVDHVWQAFGGPKTLQTDGPAYFASQEFKAAMGALGISVRHTTAYNAPSNGVVERLMGPIKDALAILQIQYRTDWDNILPFIMFAFRARWPRGAVAPPFFLTFGRPIRTPQEAALAAMNDEEEGDEKTETAEHALRESQQEAQQFITRALGADEVPAAASVDPPVHIGDKVLLPTHGVSQGSTPPVFSSKYYGPFTIVDITPHSATLQRDGAPTEPEVKAKLSTLKTFRSLQLLTDEARLPDHDGPWLEAILDRRHRVTKKSDTWQYKVKYFGQPARAAVWIEQSELDKRYKDEVDRFNAQYGDILEQKRKRSRDKAKPKARQVHADLLARAPARKRRAKDISLPEAVAPPNDTYAYLAASSMDIELQLSAGHGL